MSEETKRNQSYDHKTDEKTSYRSIFKATSLFGGVQVFQILISVIRSKIVALLLGPSGVGILGLFQSATVMIQSVTSMGLSTSAVRDVSEAHSTGETRQVARVVTTLRRLVWVTGLLGTLVVIILSPILSQASFGNKDYVIPFIFLSIVLLLDQLSAGQKVLLQGTRRLKDLAKASTFGAAIGLVVTVPIYYLFGINGIVPTLILNSLITLFFSWLFSKKIKLEKVDLCLKETFKCGATMLKMGFAMSLSGMLVYASSFFLRGFIRMVGGTEAVGVFTAGFTLLGSYVGMVFTAMNTDYYPRLASSCKDNTKMSQIVNEQGEVASLILGPLLMICLVFANNIIKLLYSDSFVLACDYLFWAIIGMMFKLGSWLVAFQVVAKGDMKTFIINEMSANVYSFILSILGYHLYGLKGLGIAFSISFLLYFIQIYFVTRKCYNFKFSSPFIKVYTIEVTLVFLCMIMVWVTRVTPLTYVIGIPMIILATVWSFYELNKRITLISMLKSRIKK